MARNHWVPCAYCKKSHPTQAALNACGAALWRRYDKTPAGAVTPTRAGADAVEPGARANLGPAREGCKP